ncbi:MAG: CynX/NimT family MFS transporter, partial [Actinomycetota bacterium]
MRATATPRWLVLTALALVAVNLRTLLTSIPAVTIDIQAATGWSDVAIGLLTTVPVIFMGAVALIVPTVAARLGRTQTVWLALAVLAFAAGIRWWATLPGVLPVSVVLAGTGIALASGLVPSIVREQLPDAIGASTGLWTSVMFTGATLGAALTVPLAQLTGSWQAALALWAVPAALAFVVWAFVETPWRRTRDPAISRVRLSSLPWRSPIAWSLTAYMAINS